MISEIDWRQDWMLWTIGVLFLFIFFLEWRSRWSRETFTSSTEVSTKTVPWRDWSMIPTLVPFNTGSVKHWGEVPPMMAAETSLSIEGTSNQPEGSLIGSTPSPQLIGITSNVGVPDLFQYKEGQEVYSWQPGRTRVILPISASNSNSSSMQKNP